jgi:hypothetical protein
MLPDAYPVGGSGYGFNCSHSEQQSRTGLQHCTEGVVRGRSAM